MQKYSRLWIVCIALCISSVVLAQWNNPHAREKNTNTLYGAFAASPKTLDPARAYSSDETGIIAQIYEPPLQYDFLKRPYQLAPLTLTKMPTVTYLDAQGKALPENAPTNTIAYSVYDLTIKPGIYFQPHPAFAKNTLPASLHDLNDFKKTGTRELTAADYVYQIKRLANPAVKSPIFGVMSKYIVGFSEYAKLLENAYQTQLAKGVKHPVLDLRDYPLSGVKIINPYEYQITIHGVYPQFEYWLAMPFFAPIPWEADLFYQQPQLQMKNITLDWYPIGTGPYFLSENNPNLQMVLKKNPRFHGETFPSTGEPGDKEKGYLKNAGAALPMVDKLILSLDKESIPRWNKFLQGYYDNSGISADNFDSAIHLNKNGEPELTESMKQKGIRLETSSSPSVFYIGFNMLDDTVGGDLEKNKKLRQAISIAIDYEEYIQLFLNGRGIVAHGPIPPGIFGYDQNNIDKAVYFSDHGIIKRKPLDEAKKLLSEAGYPNGIDPKTHKPLILNYDVASTGNPDDKSQLNWLRKQFAKLGIQLNIRETDYNRFQDKVRTGQVQIFSWGWLADYPDPENFLFLLYSANGKVKHGGENTVNYNNPRVDQLFSEIKNLPNGQMRQQKIQEVVAIIQDDAPWIFGVFPIDYTLSHQWVEPIKPNTIANNSLKYQKINPALREKLREEWNQPILWPLWILLGLLIVIFIPLIVTYFLRENRPTITKE